MNATAIAPAEMVEEAHAVLHVALAASWPAGGPGLQAVALAVLGLDEALGACQELGGGTGAAKASSTADALIRVMNDNCGLAWGGEL